MKIGADMDHVKQMQTGHGEWVESMAQVLVTLCSSVPGNKYCFFL